MVLVIKLIILLTVSATSAALIGCSISDTETDAPASQTSTAFGSTQRTAQTPITESPRVAGRVTPVSPTFDQEEKSGAQVHPSPTAIKGHKTTNPVHTPFPSTESHQNNTGQSSGKFDNRGHQDSSSGARLGDLPYKPERSIKPVTANLPTLVSPIAQSSEVWMPIKHEGRFRSLGVVSAHDVDVLELQDGTYRAYYAVDGRKIMSSASQDGLTWVQDQGIRMSNVAFPNAVLLENGAVRLFYQDGMSIGSSISTDNGLTFVEENGLRVPYGLINGIYLDNLGAPSTIRLPDERYRMYFRAGTEDPTYWNGQKSYVLSATSSNGLDFTVDPGIRVDPSNFNDGDTGAPLGYNRDQIHWVDGNDAILEADGSVNLYFFSGFCFGLCMANAQDGLQFNTYEQVMSELVTPMNELADGNGRSPGDPSILTASNNKRLMYFGQGGHDVEPREFWGVYIAEIKD